jgi:transposase-like protein
MRVEDLLFERGIDITYEAVRYWWHRFGQIFAADLRKKGQERDVTVIGNGILMRFLSK